MRDVIVCGVGKFPSLWSQTIRANGLKVRAFWERNPCWKDCQIGRIPVQVIEEGRRLLAPDHVAWLIGTSSPPDNKRWQSELQAEGVSPSRMEILGMGTPPERTNCALAGATAIERGSLQTACGELNLAWGSSGCSQANGAP